MFVKLVFQLRLLIWFASFDSSCPIVEESNFIEKIYIVGLLNSVPFTKKSTAYVGGAMVILEKYSFIKHLHIVLCCVIK